MPTVKNSFGTFLQVVNAPRPKTAPSEKKIRGFRLSTWIRYFVGMSVAGELHDAIPTEELAVPIRPKRDDDGVVQIGKNGRPKYAIGQHFNANVKAAMENIEDFLGAAGDQLQAALPEKSKELRASMRKAAERIVPVDLMDTAAAIQAYEDLKAAVALASELATTPAPVREPSKSQVPEPEKELVAA